MKHVSLLLVEPNELLLEGLRRVVTRSKFRIAYHCRSIEDLWKAAPINQEIVGVIIDASDQSVMSAAEMEKLRRTFPGAKIILMADSQGWQQLVRACENVDGLILKSSAAAVLVKALELILLGERIFPVAAWLDSGAAQPEHPRANGAGVPLALENWQHSGAAQPEHPRADGAGVPHALENLSGREIEVLKLLCKASPNKVIARQLGISEATVKVHVKAILRKTRTKNRTEAALLMSSLGAVAWARSEESATDGSAADA